MRLADADAHAAILRAVAVATVKDARAAWREAHSIPNEETLLRALRLCTLAERSLLRASEVHPAEEDEMIERALLIGELSVGLNRRLAELVETKPEQKAQLAAEGQ